MRIPLLILTALPLWAQPPFQPNAQLGVPARVGSIAVITGTKETLEHGTQREVTLESAELALTFPNRVESVVATTGEKLLILRGSLRNPEKKSTIIAGAGHVIGFRLWQRYTGTGKFSFVAHFDPDTLKYVSAQLKGGESVRFVGVWRIPADFTDFRLGVTSDRPNIVAWYDLNSSLKRLRSLFAAADGIGVNPSATVAAGTTFELDGLEMAPGGVSQPARIAGYTTDRTKPFYMVTLKVTNKLLTPARWGWQYLTAELIGSDGSATKSYPGIVNQANDTYWAGDLAPGESTVSQFLFYPSEAKQPRALRLTMGATGRQVEVALR